VTRNCSPVRAPQRPVPFEEGPQQDGAQPPACGGLQPGPATLDSRPHVS
jgi:hypothetical protein